MQTLTTLLNHAGGFKESITITPLEFDMFEIKIESRLSSAKDPEATQTRYQGFVSIQALQSLHEELQQFLY